MGSTLPDGWQQVCTKGHAAADHSTKCTNWICPQGRRYKEWADVQAYFQLLYFEEDIPGVECRPENAKKVLDIEEEEEVTLEERTKKEMDEKAKKVQGKGGVKVTELKRKRRGGGDDEESSENEEVEQVAKKKGKKKDQDDDYEPDANSSKSSVVSPKKTRRSVAAAAASKEINENSKYTSKEKAGASATLEETPENIPKKSGQVKAPVQKQDTQAGKKQPESAPEVPGRKGQAGVKVQTTKSDPKVSKRTDNNEVINLDSPSKDDKAKVVVKNNSMVASKSVSIVKIDDEIQEVKSTDQAGKKDEIVKSSTQKLYDTRFELFKEFCSSKAGGGVDPMKASTAVIEKFLQQIQKEKNLGKSVLSGYKSAIVKIQTDNKSQPEVVKSGSQPESSKPSVVAKSVTTRATITPVEAKTTTPQPAKPAQATAAAKSTTQSVGSPAQSQTKNQQTPQSRAAVAQKQQTPQTRTATAQAKSGTVANTPQSQQKQVQGTPQAKPAVQAAVRQQTPQGTPRQQTPQSNPRQQTPQSAQRNQAAQPVTRQTTPQSAQRTPASQQPATTRQTPQSNIRQNTPQSGGRHQVVQQQQVRSAGQGATPRGQGPRAQISQVATPRQQGPQVRGIQPSPQQRQATPQARQQTPQPRQQKPQQAQNSPQVRQQQPNQVKQQAGNKPVAASPQQQPKYTELPAFLKGLVNFSCKLETNAGGGPSLYRAAAQHAGVGQEGWQELRKYCHVKLLEWWQWYQPYYTFPIQVKLRMRNQTIQKTVPSSTEFQKFLKSDESLYSFHMSECELYCLANILGVPIYQLTYNLVGVGGKPEERCRWDTLDPHHGLIHQNKFNKNKEPLYILYEDKIHFSKIVQNK